MTRKSSYPVLALLLVVAVGRSASEDAAKDFYARYALTI